MPTEGQIYKQCKLRHLEAKFSSNAHSATWYLICSCWRFSNNFIVPVAEVAEADGAGQIPKCLAPSLRATAKSFPGALLVDRPDFPRSKRKEVCQTTDLDSDGASSLIYSHRGLFHRASYVRCEYALVGTIIMHNSIFGGQNCN